MMNEVVIDVGDAEFLDVDFGVANELLIVNSGGSSASACHAVDWAFSSPLTRHATLLAVHGNSSVHRVPPIGLVSVSDHSISADAEAISDALNTVASEEIWAGGEEGLTDLADLHLEGAKNCAAVWDLLSSLMFMQHDPVRYISEELVQWAIKHSEVLSSGLATSLYEYDLCFSFYPGTNMSVDSCKSELSSVGSSQSLLNQLMKGVSRCRLGCRIAAAGFCCSSFWRLEIRKELCIC